MSEGFTKLFSDIVDSSIWAEDSDTCKVWVTLLALCNADGFVRGSVGWLSGKSKVSPQVCAAALAKFAAPDPHSRTPDNEGRRIEFLDDGWLILNYLMFRERLSVDTKLVKTRERVRRHRERYRALHELPSVTSHVTASASASASGDGKGSGVREGFTMIQELMCRLSVAFNRPPAEPWSYSEESAAAEVARRPGCLIELDNILKFRKNTEYFPQSVNALLQKWPEVLDRSRNGASPVAGVPLWRQVQSITDLIAKHPANRQSTFHNPKCTHEQKADLATLRKKLDELNDRMAGTGGNGK